MRTPLRWHFGFRADPLLFYAPGAAQSLYVWLAACSCSDESCNAVIAHLILENGTATWKNVRRQVEDGSDILIHDLGLSFVFDEAQYRRAGGSSPAEAPQVLCRSYAGCGSRLIAA
jgi:hypothetical protein